MKSLMPVFSSLSLCINDQDWGKIAVMVDILCNCKIYDTIIIQKLFLYCRYHEYSVCCVLRFYLPTKEQIGNRQRLLQTQKNIDNNILVIHPILILCNKRETFHSLNQKLTSLTMKRENCQVFLHALLLNGTSR